MTSSTKQIKKLNTLLRHDLLSFIRKAFHTVSPGVEFLDNWHINAIAYALERCIQGDTNRLVISLPPRYLKSLCVTVALPAFLLGRDPTARIICASYSKELGQKHASDSQMVMESDWYRRAFPGTANTLKKVTQSELVTEKNGFRLAASVGGTLTGRGGNLLIIDDPHKADEAHSDTKRKAVIDWFEHTAATRLDDKEKGIVIIIHQRLHQADLAGSQLEKGYWHHLNLPAIAEEDCEIPIGPDEYFYRQCDDVLHPERHSLEHLMQIKLEMGDYAFASQYQQRPSPLGGGLVKWSWFRTYPFLKHRMHAEYVVQSWDTATTAGERSDWSVCTTWYCMEGNLYLVDLHRAKYEFPELKNKVFELANKFQATDVVIEAVGAGRALHQQIEHELRHMSERQFILRASNPKDDKPTRLMGETSEIEAGRVQLPKSAEWLDEFQRELLNFPNGVHDDQVDSLTQLLRWDRRFYRYQSQVSAMFV
jgi:predicted phage terminase large subunit-like protein